MIGTIADGQLLLAHDRRIPCVIRYSGRAVRMRMTLSAEGSLTVILPMGTSRQSAENFVRANLLWIERTLLKLALKQRRKPEFQGLFPTAFHFPVTGEHFSIRYEWRDVCWTGVLEEEEFLLVSGRVLDAEMVHEALRNYLIRKAARVLEPMVRSLAEKYSFWTGKISVRFQRGRWGSCSRARDLSLNAQMLFLNPDEVQYVILHELCHTREMNHSERFWREVARYCPDYLRIRKNLKKKQFDF
ncbi:MAG: M48 family metallopeptidase [Lentisphaeria bacterium]|nr:M48 family metallopeptidase [Lentisphaeria bacterium]